MIFGIKLFQFELVHVPGHLHTGPDGLSCHAASPNNLIDEDEDTDDWLDRTMSFAIVLMNSRPSWSSRLNSSYRPTRVASYWLISYRPISFQPSHQKLFPVYSIYLEDEGPKEVPTPVIPCSVLAQHANDRLDAVCTMLLNPLSPTDLSEPGICGLIHYASKFFLLNGKLMRCDPQGCHKVVMPKEKHFFLITRAHEIVGHRAIFSTLSNLQERFWWLMLDDDVKWFVSTCHP